MSIIQRDLQRHIDKRLQLWLKDSLSLYYSAELPFAEAVTDVTLTMATKLCQLTNILNMPPNMLAKLIHDAAIIVQRPEEAQEESQQ